ncbi:MAG: hypothetical protein K1X83_12590 [Oligoflexia bacterium]|nr:hypothetical protein [Oligoflexia bacterium]
MAALIISERVHLAVNSAEVRRSPDPWTASHPGETILSDGKLVIPGFRRNLRNLDRQVGELSKDALQNDQIRYNVSDFLLKNPAAEPELFRLLKLCDEDGRVALSNLMTRQLPNGKAAILDRGIDDRTVFQNIVELATTELAPDVARSRRTTLTAYIQEIANPGTEPQGLGPLCHEAAFQFLGASRMPGEISRLSLGLLRPQGTVRLKNGELLKRVPDAFSAPLRRKARIDPGQVLRAALMDYLSGDQIVYSETDQFPRFAVSGLPVVTSTNEPFIGTTESQSRKLFSAVLGINVRSVYPTWSATLEQTTERLRNYGKNLMKWLKSRAPAFSHHAAPHNLQLPDGAEIGASDLRAGEVKKPRAILDIPPTPAKRHLLNNWAFGQVLSSLHHSEYALIVLHWRNADPDSLLIKANRWGRHTVAFERLTPERIYFRNSHLRLDLKPGAELPHPPRILENPETGEESMSISDFRDYLSYVQAAPQRIDFKKIEPAAR